MDPFIAQFDGAPDGDLMIAEGRGVAWQRDASRLVPYDQAYFDKYVGYAGSPIAERINRGRVDFVDCHVGAGARVLDIGIGCGEFIRRRANTCGFDVNPAGVRWLKENEAYSEDFGAFAAFTFWDVLEHVPNPATYFEAMPDGCHVFACLPIFEDLRKIRASKHYRPNEHLYYFTATGFARWMALYGFRLLDMATFESAAGRDSILSFAFRRG